MRFIDGSTAGGALAEYEGGMPPQRAVNIVEKVAAALDFAHRHHIVHRDVKPANILLTVGDDGDQERVYLTDFGVAKAMGGIEAQATALTTAGNVVATLDFAAPEQIEGQSLDGRCDVYALGCVLYKLLTGAIPYPGENLGAKVYARMHRPPPAPTATNATVPPAFDRVVATALALDPDDRYQTGRALAVAARSAISGGPGNSPSTQGVSRGDSSATEYPGTSGRRVLLAATGRSAFPEGRRPGPAGPAGGSRPTIEGPSERHPEALPDNTSGFALDVGDPADDPAERLPPDFAQLSAPGLQKGSGAGPTRPSSGGRARRRSTVAFGCVLVPALLITVISLVQRGGVAGTPALRAAASATLPTTAASPGGQPTATSSGTTKSATSSGGTRTSAAGIRPVVGLPHSRPLGANIVVVSRGYGSKFALCPLDAQTGKVGNPISRHEITLRTRSFLWSAAPSSICRATSPATRSAPSRRTAREIGCCSVDRLIAPRSADRPGIPVTHSNWRSRARPALANRSPAGHTARCPGPAYPDQAGEGRRPVVLTGWKIVDLLGFAGSQSRWRSALHPGDRWNRSAESADRRGVR